MSGKIPDHVQQNPILAIARDADRLDAIGAIGVARCCAYSAVKNRPILLCDILAGPDDKAEASETSAVAHFHEKLLKLKDLFLTETGRKMAEKRHLFLVEFLQQLESEVN